RGFDLHASSAGGWDSNPAMAGNPRTASARTVGTPTGGAPTLVLDLDLAARAALGDRGTGELRYGLDQVAFSDSRFDAYALQQHELGGALEWSAASRLRLLATLRGVLIFTGLQTYEAFQRGLAPGAAVAVDEHQRTTTRLEVERGSWSTFDRAY